MTTRLSTIEYAFQTNFSTLTASTLYNFTGITVTMPETTARTFVSAYMEVFFQADVTAASSNTTAPTASFKLGSASADAITFGTDTANGTQYHALFSGHLVQDLTAYFTANFGGSSTQTAALGVTFPVATQNISARLVITYEFTDADNTRAKTVRIPIEGYAGALPTSLTSIGSSTDIPNLSTFCPEGSATFVNVYVEITYNARLPSLATFTTTWGIDGTTQAEATHQDGGESAGNYGCFHVLWQQNSLSTSATHQFQGETSLANSVYNVCAVLVATYTYSESGTTTVLNSVLVPFTDSVMGPNTNSTTNRATWTTTFYVAEPATCTLVQSAVRLATIQAFDFATTYDAIQLRVGAQSYRSYTHPGITEFCAPYGEASFQQRCDAGATEGAGFTFARGVNTVTMDAYGNGSNDESQSPTEALLYLNYTSAVASGGTATHAKTIKSLLVSTKNATLLNDTFLDFGSLNPPDPPETNWWCNGVAFVFDYSLCSPIWITSILSGEKQGSGQFVAASAWVALTGASQGPDAVRHIVTGPDRTWDRNSAEVDTARCNPFSSRRWMRYGAQASGSMTAIECWYTYHAITFAASGTASGYTGAGSGITVNMHRNDTGELIATTTTTSGGSFSATVFDNVTSLYAEAYQDGTHLGRSALATGS